MGSNIKMNTFEVTVLDQIFWTPERVKSYQQGFLNEEGPCPIVNGVLAPTPLSAIPFETETQNEDLPETSMAQLRKRTHPNSARDDGVVEPHQQPCNGGPSTEEQPLPTTTAIRTTELFFKLFKIARTTEDYILEQHEVETGKKNQCQLSVNEDKGKWKLKKTLVGKKEHYRCSVVEDPSIPMFHKKYALSLQDRLKGWILKVCVRGNGVKDKFYHHMGKQFRSMVEVSTYIIYSCKRDLLPVGTERSHEFLEAEAVEAMMIMSSTKEENHNHVNANIGGPSIETKNSTTGAELEDESDGRRASFQLERNSEEEAFIDANVNLGGNEILEVEVGNPTEERVSLPPRFNDGPVQRRHTFEDMDDIFANLPDIQNLNSF